MQCTKPIRLEKRHYSKRGAKRFDGIPEDGLLVPCGKCVACRKKKAYEWSVRCVHELTAHKDAVFVTLTYNDRHIPDYGSLCKRDLQLFFKRLRKSIEPIRIRYFACGEYGERTRRPHYHAIIFGLGLNIFDQNKIRDAWDLGLVHFGLAEPASIRYVSQYINKKVDGELAAEIYAEQHIHPVFKIQSLGLGRVFADLNMDQIRQQLMLTVGGIKMSIPRYYVERLGLDKDLLSMKAKTNEQSVINDIVGEPVTRDDAYRTLSVDKVLTIESTLKDRADNRANHLQAKIDIINQKKRL
nr:MAG: replication initiator protein [Microviridae sp.]